MVIDVLIQLINLLVSFLFLCLGIACLLSPLGVVEVSASIVQNFLPVDLFIHERSIPMWLLRAVGIVAILVSLWFGFLALSALTTLVMG